MNNEADTLTRKEIADLIGKSVTFIVKREADLGLLEFRNPLSKRPILYNKAAVMAQLKGIGLLPGA